jgi:hypothetical protein
MSCGQTDARGGEIRTTSVLHQAPTRVRKPFIPPSVRRSKPPLHRVFENIHITNEMFNDTMMDGMNDDTA